MSLAELFKDLPPANPNSEFQLVKRQTTNRYFEEIQAASEERDSISMQLATENLLAYVRGLPIRPEQETHFFVKLVSHAKAVWHHQEEEAKQSLQELRGFIAAVPDPNAQTAKFKRWQEPGTFKVQVVGVYSFVNSAGILLTSNIVADAKGEFYGVPYSIEFEDKPILVTLYVTERQHPKFNKLLVFNMVRL